MSSSKSRGNFGYPVQVTRRKRIIIAQRNGNEPSLRQMKPLIRSSALANEKAATRWSHARGVHGSSANVATLSSTICLLFAL